MQPTLKHLVAVNKDCADYWLSSTEGAGTAVFMSLSLALVLLFGTVNTGSCLFDAA